MRIKLALRNTFRNSRRTWVSVWMIAGGLTGLVLFQGFSHKMISEVREIVINAQFGHFQIASSTHWNNTFENPKESLLPKHQAILELIKKQKHVNAVSGRLSFVALMSAGERSTSAQGLSLSVQNEPARIKAMNIVEGGSFTGTSPYEALLGQPLARQLGVKPGDTFAALTYTYDGIVNALDLRVTGLFNTTLADFDKSTFLVPLEAAQRLLDTDGVEKLVIDLDDTEATDTVITSLAEDLKALDSGVRARSWLDLATFYHEVASFYRVYDRVIEIIVLTLVLLGIMNTVGMAIYERTGEIGTLRALGFTESRIVQQFVSEGIVLGVLGAAFGSVLAVVIAKIANSLKIPITMPGATTPIPVEFELLPTAFLYTGILVLITTIVAAYIPAKKAARKEIVEALRHNI